MSLIDPNDPIKPLLDKARFRQLLSDVAVMIESSGATEVYFVVAVPQVNGGVMITCADTGTTRYGKQAVETFYAYIKNKS